MWLTQLLDRNQQCFGDRVAVVDQDRKISWRELARRARNVAGGLARYGLRHGDRVAVLSRDRAEVVETYFALGRLGAVIVPLDHRAPGGRLDEIAGHAMLAAVIGQQDLLAKIGAAGPPVRLAFEEQRYQELAEFGQDDVLPTVASDDLVAILYTFTPAGRPRGVVIDHRSLKDIALGWLAIAEPHDGMVLASCSPLFHGSVGLSLAYMAAGASIVLLADANPEQIAAALGAHGATHVWLAPETLRALLRSGAFADGVLTELREIMYGPDPLSGGLYAEAAGVFRGRFRHVYGLTEVGGPLVTLGPGEHPAPESGRWPDTPPVGRVIPGMSLRIVAGDGTTLPPGSVGELCVRGDGVLRGYWNDPAAMAAIMLNGWVRTGNLGYLDERGYLHLLDREWTDRDVQGESRIDDLGAGPAASTGGGHRLRGDRRTVSGAPR